LRFLASALLLAGAVMIGCGKKTELESGAVLLDLSVADGVSTPDELFVSVYDDAGILWKASRVPPAGPLVPESATHLGTVLIQPGAAQGALRLHVRAQAAGTRVAEGTLAIPAAMRGRFALTLEAAVPADDDGDGVPDAVDDCPGVSNPDQGGCPGTNDGGDDGGGTDAFNCDAAGGCNRPIGSPCADSAQCTSSFCVDSVCCANACEGPCRSCNQPNNDGVCLPYAQGTDPAGECSGAGTDTCNGVGACGPAPGGPKMIGELCGAGTECMSTFCKDGVCCNEACDGQCRTCASGTCVNVTRKPDPPECEGTMTCNAAARCVLQ
jgi:hypothetical protein